jgi:phosphoglycolate phosphatase-like HAD superfamily hydrolase
MSATQRVSGSVPTLLLFDIDGTLVAGASHLHAQALHDAIKQVHGVDVRQARADGVVISPAGRTDNEIARLLLQAVGVGQQQIDAGAGAVEAATCARYDELCPADISELVLPGIAKLLAWLAAQDSARLSLVTGNFEPVARRKLGAAGIGKYFRPDEGGFGSDSELRAELPAFARRRSGTRAGYEQPWPAQRAIVIGDTPRDIACARADGVRCVAVATGRYSVDQLLDADAVAADAYELQPVLARLL